MKYNDFLGEKCNGVLLGVVLLKCVLFVWNVIMFFYYNYINIWVGL